ncbi:sensor histidine kinase [Propionibacteriaceae bacterium G57]|uniref:sensor histidine kinase n=1 Tax=Aestuariimicrobium sp. G57 TaxID=3418485 RepID=UPI003DA6E6FA
MSFPAAPPHDLADDHTAFRTNAIVVVVMAMVLGVPHLLAVAAGIPGAIAAYLTGEAMVMGLLWRRRNPRRMLTIVTIAGIVQMLTVSWPTLFLVVIPIAVYSYARWVEGRPRLVLVIGFAASVLGPVSWFPGLRPPDYDMTYGGDVTALVLFVIVCAGLVVTPYAFGRRIRDAELVKEQRMRAQQEQYLAAIRNREQAVRMAEIDTRNQIARELHDIVAHSVSVMIVQAEGGRAMATKKPEAAAEVLTTIAETGREALTEMRRLLGVLRAGPDSGAGAADWAPAPRVGDIAAMVERAGERVSFEQVGMAPPLSQALQLTIYRIAQEGVTNFLKHAGPDARCQVELRYEGERVTLSVVDDGLGAGASSDGVGHGLRGMHERVQAMGGTLEAHPRQGGTGPDQRGFIVRATFPFRPVTGRQQRGAPPRGDDSGAPARPVGTPPSRSVPYRPPYAQNPPIPIPRDPRLEES